MIKRTSKFQTTLNDPIEHGTPKPINISWIIDSDSLVLGRQCNKTIGDVDMEGKKHGKFGLCHCPGKKLAKGRDGKVHNRDLKSDVLEFKETQVVQTIICLLNEYELRSIGVDLKQYKRICDNSEIKFIHYPMIEMSTPECKELVEFDEGLIAFIVNEMRERRNIICHCRGGIGRAGLIASCLLMKLELFKSAALAIQRVRNLRDKRCVESRKQEAFVASYAVFLSQNKISPNILN